MRTHIARGALSPLSLLFALCQVSSTIRLYDSSPFSPSGRFLAIFRFPEGIEGRPITVGLEGHVIVVELRTGRQRVVAATSGFDSQVGAQVQWGATDDDLLFNDLDESLPPLTGGAIDNGTLLRASTLLVLALLLHPLQRL